MDDQLLRSYLRWSDAERGGRDEEADAAFLRVFEAVSRGTPVSADFTARTMAAVSAAAARDLRRARRTRGVLVPAAIAGGAALAYAGAGLLVSLFSTVTLWLLDASVQAVVAVATGDGSGPSVWPILASIGRAAAALTADPAVTGTLLALQGVAILGLLALQHLLGSDRESFR